MKFNNKGGAREKASVLLNIVCACSVIPGEVVPPWNGEGRQRTERPPAWRPDKGTAGHGEDAWRGPLHRNGGLLPPWLIVMATKWLPLMYVVPPSSSLPPYSSQGAWRVLLHGEIHQQGYIADICPSNTRLARSLYSCNSNYVIAKWDLIGRLSFLLRKWPCLTVIYSSAPGAWNSVRRQSSGFDLHV